MGRRLVSPLLQDLRYAVRALRKSPAFTAVALATLALGIGANTAIFSVVNAVLLKPLVFPESGRLVAFYQTLPREGVMNNGVSYLNYADFASRSRSFEQLGALRMHDFTLTGRGEPALVVAGTVTGNIFQLLRTKPLLGRSLTAADEAPDAPAVAVLSERLWRERFGGAPAAVGQTVRLDQKVFTVVGVMPGRFRSPPDRPPAELWTALAQDPVFGDLRQRRGGHYLTVVGRLRPGVALATAQAEVATLAAGLARQFPKENEGWGTRIVPLAESLVSGVRTALSVLLGAVALVFLIACVNVANLMLMRSSARSRELAVRTALGAGRGRLARQLLTESLVLGLSGGALGVALALSGMKALKAWLPADLPRVSEVGIDGRVLIFSFFASLAATLVFGVGPALAAGRANLSAALREGSAGAGESGGRRRLRGLLIAGETAFSFVLLVGAALLIRSFVRLQEVPLGFRPAGVLTAGMSLPRTQYADPQQWIGFYTALVDRLAAEPGVEAAAASLPLPLAGAGLNFAFSIEGHAEEPGADKSANYTAATPGYFRVMGVPLVSGRTFSQRDGATAPRVCVVSAAFARRYFPGENPLGKRLVFGFPSPVAREIVGVVGDVKRDGLALPSQPEMYVPFVQEPWWAAYALVRTSGDPARLSSAMRADVKALDPSLPLEDVAPMRQFVDDSVAQPRFRTTVLGLFGAAALLLAVLGIYGVISYSVGRRTREVGIRLALGAAPSDVLRMVLFEGLGLVALGLALGLAGALLSTRYLSSLLFEVSRLDALSYAGVAALLLLAGLAASWLPARRATRVDPVSALRAE
jgi:putative ABC transport system permease protein